MAPPRKKPAARKSQGRTTAPKPKVVIPDAPTPVSEWKKASDATNLEVPSGNVAQVTNPGLATFLTQGIIPNALMPIVNRAMEGKQPKRGEVAALITSPEEINAMLEFVDKVALACVLQPKLSPAPPEGAERDPGVLYVDQVDLEDKLFIFQWVMGGTRDLEPFRTELNASLEPVSPV